jgi:hypothetical protein
VIGPLFNWVVPCLVIGCVMLGAGVLVTAMRLVRR